MRRHTIAAALALLALLLPAAPLAAQTTTVTLQWTQPNALSDAQSFTYTLKDGSAAAVTLSGVTCATVSSATQCQAAIAALAPGTHSLVLTATSTLGTASSAALAGAAPGVPVQVTVIVKVVGP